MCKSENETERGTERERESWQRHVFARHIGLTCQLIHSRFEDEQKAIKVCCVIQCEGDVTIFTAF